MCNGYIDCKVYFVNINTEIFNRHHFSGERVEMPLYGVNVTRGTYYHSANDQLSN